MKTPLYVDVKKWRLKNKAEALGSLNTNFIWQLPNHLVCKKYQELSDTLQWDFLQWHAYPAYWLERSGADEPMFDIMNVETFFQRYDFTTYSDILEQMLIVSEKILGVSRKDFQKVKIYELIEADQKIAQTIHDALIGLSDRYREVASHYPLTDQIWEEVNRWPELNEVNSSEVSAIIEKIKKQQ